MADPAPNNPQVQLPGMGDAAEPWALESTLTKILQVLQRDLNQGTKQARSADALNRNVDRLIRTIDKTGTSSNDITRRELSATEQNRRALQDLQRTSRRQAAAAEETNRNQRMSKNTARDNLLGGGGAGGGSLIGSLAKSAVSGTVKTVTGATKGILNSGGDLTTAMSDVAKSLPGVMGTLAGASVGMATDIRQQMTILANAGQTFSGNMTQFAQEAANASLSIPQAVSILTANSEAAAKIGGPQFLKLQRQVRNTTEAFGRFGLSVEDQASVVADFYQLQMMRGNSEKAQNAKAAADYTAKMAALSKLTGKSIDELSKNQQELTTDADLYAGIQRVFDRYGPVAAANAQKLVDNVIPQFDQQSQGALKDMMSSFMQFGSINQSDLGLALSKGNRQDLIPILDAAIKSGDEGKLMSVLQQIGKEGMTVGSSLREVTSNMQAGFKDQQSITSFFGAAAKISSDQIAGVADAKAKLEKENSATGTNQTSTYDQNQTQVQQALGTAYASMLARSLELIPGIQAMTIAAADVTNRLVNSDSLKEAINQTTTALIDLSNNIPKLLDSLTMLDDLDNVIASVITSVGDFGEALGKAVGLPSGVGRAGALLLGAGAGAGALSMGKGLLTGGAGAASGGMNLSGAALAKAGKFSVGGLVVGVGGEMAADALKSGGYETAGKLTSVGSSAASGAMTGAALGSIIPGLGTAFGAAAGAAIGGGIGIYSNYFSDPETSKPKSMAQTPQIKAPPPASAKPAIDSQTEYQKIRVGDQKQYTTAQIANLTGEKSQLQAIYNYRIQMEKIYFNYQISLAKIRHTYEMALMNIKYKVNNGNVEKNQKFNATTADAAFRSQIDQAKKVRSSMDQYQEKAARMGALGQAGIIVQPMIGDDMESKQLQELRLANQFLYNIYDNQRGTKKFRPLVEIYQSGL